MSRRRAATLHRRVFHAEPEHTASAPGRVNLIGEHTDYNGGPVLPIPLPWRTTVAVSRASRFSVVSELEPEIRPLGRAGYTAYIRGVIDALRDEGVHVPPARVAIASDVPAGAGLASSAALTVATAKALSALAGASLPRASLVDVAYRAEHDHVGVRCGRMDQVAAVHGRQGHALLFETATGRMRQVPAGRRSRCGTPACVTGSPADHWMLGVPSAKRRWRDCSGRGRSWSTLPRCSPVS